MEKSTKVIVSIPLYCGNCRKKTQHYALTLKIWQCSECGLSGPRKKES